MYIIFSFLIFNEETEKLPYYNLDINVFKYGWVI